MKRKALLAIVGLLAGLTMIPTAAAGVDDEAKLARKLRNYEQNGPAMSCVSLAVLRGNDMTGATAIVFQGKNSQIFVNRPEGGCPIMRLGRALHTRTGGSRLCRGDLATIWDPVSNVEYGSCPLGDFTPYRRLRR